MLLVTKRLRIESGLENGSCGTHFNILFSQRAFIYFLTYFLKDSEFCCSNKKKKKTFYVKKIISARKLSHKKHQNADFRAFSSPSPFLQAQLAILAGDWEGQCCAVCGEPVECTVAFLSMIQTESHFKTYIRLQ